MWRTADSALAPGSIETSFDALADADTFLLGDSGQDADHGFSIRRILYAETSPMRLRAFILAFLDGFTLGGFFAPSRRPSAPEYLFAQDDDEDAEADDALRGGE